MAVGVIYVDTGGATTNSGTTDTNGATLSGTGDAVVTGSTVQLTIGTDLSGIAADGSQAIYLAQASNSNQKIFWITGKDDALDQVTVSVAPTGVTASNWTIGGRLVWTPANVESALRGGDTIQFNNDPATRTAAYFTARNSGDSTLGQIRIIGKSGVRPLLNVTSGNVNCLALGALNNYYVSNLEVKAAGATSAAVVSGTGSGITVDNIKVSQSGGGAGVSCSASGFVIMNSEITGVGDGINGLGAFFGNYIHAVSGDCIEIVGAGPTAFVANNVLTTASGRGIFISGAATSQAHVVVILSNTIYGNTLAGLEVTDTDTRVMLYNNIIMNTNSADIVKWTAGNAQLVSSHGYNLFFSSSTGVLNGLTANSTELTSDPLFTTPGSGDFTLQTGSPAKATAYPGVFLGGNTGYLDMGALQRQEPAGGSGGGMRLAGHGGLAA